jgi:hypothetical protein
MACGAAPFRDFLIERARPLSPAASVTVQNLIQIISAWNARGPELVPAHDTSEELSLEAPLCRSTRAGSDMSKQSSVDRIWDIIEKVGVCMLATQRAGRLRARPME